MRVAAIELGGTNAVVSVGSGPDDLAPPVTLPTTTPAETLSSVCDVLADFRDQGWRFDAVGIAAFGPLGLHEDQPTFGHVLATPKPGWSGADIVGRLIEAFGLPTAIDTDVNGAALGEGAWGASKGLGEHAYVTVGTGVGVGVVINGRSVRGLLHPEAGHILVRRDPQRDPFGGVCPWHGDCVEGLVSGVALAKRMPHVEPKDIDPGDPVWALVGDYLGQALAATTLVASPRRIVLGGGVGRRPEVLAATRIGLAKALGGYIQALDGDGIDAFLAPPGLGSLSGLLGAVRIGQGLQTAA